MESGPQHHQLERKVMTLTKNLKKLLERHHQLQGAYEQAQRSIKEKNRIIEDQNQQIKDFQLKSKKAKIAGIGELEDVQKKNLEGLIDQCLLELDDLIEQVEQEE